jgi:glutathione S-transferase
LPELYDHVLSDRCYAVRLILSLLRVTYVKRTVSYAPSQSPPSPEVVAFNPAGEIPVFVDGDLVLSDVTGILLHLCKEYDPAGLWRAEDAAAQHWLDFAAEPLASVSKARATSLFGTSGDPDALVAASRAALRVLEDHLTNQSLAGVPFLVGKQASLADVAVFPAVALSHDCGIGHEDYPAINLWQRRVRKLPHFITMPGVPDYF